MPSITQLLIAGGIIRAILMLYSVYHDRTFRVKYTDIDYMIITDGAAEMAKGGTPFDRATFRYTPLLSLLMLPNVWWWLHCGKALFALCDVGAAWFCYRTLLTFATEKSAKIAVSVFILFNPIVVQVSTRGNSDMVVAFLSLAALASYFQKRYVVSAMWLGFAIHFKLYPVIYVIPFVFGLIEERRRQQSSKKAKSSTFLGATLSSLPLMIACGVAAVVLFAVPTYLCYKAYGQQYLDEALLYHFHREDHRHNMSPYWLAMYLNQGRRALVASAAASGETASIPTAWLVDYSAGWIAFAPQAAVLLFVSYRLRFNVAHACCIQTVLFVAFNKVCTVQYFVWFLPFLSFLFCVPKAPGTGGSSKRTTGRSPFVALLVVLLWATTIPLWMRAAYEVEFLGNNDFILLWGASCVFFLATVGLAGWLGRIAIEMQKDVSTRRTE